MTSQCKQAANTTFAQSKHRIFRSIIYKPEKKRIGTRGGRYRTVNLLPPYFFSQCLNWLNLVSKLTAGNT